MSPVATQQLQAIHNMLSAGHRNLRIERHSLLLWGIPAGLLFAFSEQLLTPQQIPDLTTRALAWLLLLVGVLGAVGGLDWWWTRRVKQARDEAWSFIQRQVQKVWWLLMGLATLCTFGMFFFGGGYMVCALWLVIIGLGLHLHGLFSEELLEWIGGAMMLTGIGSLFAGLHYESMRWIAAATFGLGMPLLAMMLDRGRHRPFYFRLAQLLGWLLVALALPLSVQKFATEQKLPEAPLLTLDEFRNGGLPPDGNAVVSLPAGTRVPVDIEVSGDIFASTGNPAMYLTLTRPVELPFVDGQLADHSRFPGESWQNPKKARWVQIPWIKAELAPDLGPVIRSQLIVTLGRP